MQYAAITANAAGDNEIVAAVPGRRIRLVGYVLSFGGTVNVKWRSATTDKSGLLYGLLGGVIVSGTPAATFGGQPQGHLETAAGEALNLNLSGAVACGGHLVYDLVQ